MNKLSCPNNCGQTFTSTSGRTLHLKKCAIKTNMFVPNTTMGKATKQIKAELGELGIKVTLTKMNNDKGKAIISIDLNDVTFVQISHSADRLSFKAFDFLGKRVQNKSIKIPHCSDPTYDLNMVVDKITAYSALVLHALTKILDAWDETIMSAGKFVNLGLGD